MNEPIPSLKSKRGRKPFGDRAMTSAELKKSSRNRLAREGSGEFMIRADKGMLNLIDQLAQVQGQSRSEVVEILLDMALSKVGSAIADAEVLRENGATDEIVVQHLRKAFSFTPSEFAIEKYKVVMGVK